VNTVASKGDRFMKLGFHVPIFDIDGGTTAIAGELARSGAIRTPRRVNSEASRFGPPDGSDTRRSVVP
jgi:hypothetical protein